MSRKPKSARTPPSASDRLPSELRIIGGEMRGRKLAYSGDPLTRPMKDRVREAVFNLVGPSIAGKYALDLFAGTGALGLEALSRGAKNALFIERHFPTARLIEQNCRAIGVESRTEVIPTSAFAWARLEIERESAPAARWREAAGDAPWAIFVSPPYAMYVEQQSDMLRLIAVFVERSPPESVVVVECDERFDANLLPRAESWDVRKYPPAVVAIFRKD